MKSDPHRSRVGFPDNSLDRVDQVAEAVLRCDGFFSCRLLADEQPFAFCVGPLALDELADLAADRRQHAQLLLVAILDRGAEEFDYRQRLPGE